MGDRLRYGIIGTGLMGCEHIRNLAVLDGAEVVACADPEPRSLAFAEFVTQSLAGTAVAGAPRRE